MLKFLSNVNILASPSEGLCDVPDDVLVLGGAFIADGNQFSHKWKDVGPGEIPKI